MGAARAPMRKPKGQYHHGNLAKALVEAAVQVIEEQGAQSFTVREAARRIGVDHRAAYRHFPDRDALLAAVAEETYRDLRRTCDEALANASLSSPLRLLAMARAYATFARYAPGRYALMTGPRLNESGRFQSLEEAAQDAFRVVKDEITRGIENGELHAPDVVEAALALWAAMHGLASLVQARRIRVRRDDAITFAERAIGYTVRGMMVPRST